MKRFFANPLGVFGLVLVVAVVSAAVLAPWIAPYDPVALNVMNRLQPPSVEHWLGTDQLGRDIFSRVLYGGQVALQVAGISVTAALFIGTLLGMIAGLGPRWLDGLIVLLFDTVRSFPTVVFALAVVAAVGPSLATVVGVVIVTAMPIFGRIVRTQTASLRQREFILAERSLGASTGYIMVHHVLPNVLGPVFILAAMEIPVVIFIEAGLSFLGLGIRPPTPSWGTILNDGYSFIRTSPWPVIAGGIPLVITTLGFTFLGEALRDTFDPKLQREL
ncbi:MAG: ABC transporter permease [Candidatus Competibacterales bacterium]